MLCRCGNMFDQNDKYFLNSPILSAEHFHSNELLAL